MNPGRVVSQFQVASLFGRAYERAATMQTAVHGFKRTGIYPTHRHVFTETDFTPSKTTDIPEIQNNSTQFVEVTSPVFSPSELNLQPDAVAGLFRIDVHSPNNVHSPNIVHSHNNVHTPNNVHSFIKYIHPIM